MNQIPNLWANNNNMINYLIKLKIYGYQEDTYTSLQIQLLSTKDKGRPWPQFIHDFEVNCSKLQ
jgi:hypothetical protein